MSDLANDAATRRLTVVWILLMSLTILTTWGLANEWLSAEIGTPLILAVAALKVRWLMLDFMELRNAPVLGRLIFELWAVVVACLLVGLYLV